MARLPSTATLQALEAAVRHRSYSKAARELHLTHGAISHQLRRLELDLGAVLFRRSGNDMLPTPEAQQLALAFAKAFGDIERALEAVHRSAELSPLVLSLESHFAGRWLGPRLPGLAGAGLNVDLRVDDRVADFVTDGVDVAVRQGLGPWPDVEQHRLFDEELLVVASPRFLQEHPIASPADLLALPLIQPAFGSWASWFEAHGMEAPVTNQMPNNDSELMIAGAVQGLGVALARSVLAEMDLRSGRLVQPLPGAVSAGSGYTLVWRADSRKLERILRLRDWFAAEVAAA
jgi:LysR family glycine cleavage system transcriptional activator